MKTKWLALILGIIVLASAAVLLFAPKAVEGRTASIYLDGELFRTVDLVNVKEPYTIEVGQGNTVLVEKGRIRMEQADCPDKLCVDMGWSSSASKPIVCLPNKVLIVVDSGSDDEVDAVVR
jgi:hypothetical protein